MLASVLQAPLRNLAYLISQLEGKADDVKSEPVETKIEESKVEEAKEDEANTKVVATLKLNMAIIPAGSFRMGCVSERYCKKNEKPVHQVKIKAFKLGATEVTFDQWDACVAAGVGFCHGV